MNEKKERQRGLDPRPLPRGSSHGILRPRPRDPILLLWRAKSVSNPLLCPERCSVIKLSAPGIHISYDSCAGVHKGILILFSLAAIPTFGAYKRILSPAREFIVAAFISLAVTWVIVRCRSDSVAAASVLGRRGSNSRTEDVKSRFHDASAM